MIYKHHHVRVGSKLIRTMELYYNSLLAERKRKKWVYTPTHSCKDLEQK